MFAKGKTAKQFKKVLTKQDIRSLDVKYQPPVPKCYQDSNIGTFDQSRRLIYAHCLNSSTRETINTPVICDKNNIVYFSKQSGCYSKSLHKYSEVLFLNPIDLHIYNGDLLCECFIQIDAINGKAIYNEITPKLLDEVSTNHVSHIDQKDLLKYFACKKHWHFDSATPIGIESFIHTDKSTVLMLDSIDTTSSINFNLERRGRSVMVDKLTVNQAVTPPIISSIMESPLCINILDISQLSFQLCLKGNFDINKVISEDFRKLFFIDSTKSKIENTNVVRYYRTHFKNPLESRLVYVDRIGTRSNEVRNMLKILGAILTPAIKEAEYFIYSTIDQSNDDFINSAYSNYFLVNHNCIKFWYDIWGKGKIQ